MTTETASLHPIPVIPSAPVAISSGDVTQTTYPSAVQPNSPVGQLIVTILAKRTGITYKDARTLAHTMLAKSAGAKVYRTPKVYTLGELAERKEKFAAFRRSKETETPEPAIT